MRKEPNRIIHVVLDAGVGENQPFSARLLTQVHPLAVVEPGDVACQAGEPQLHLSASTLLSWDCCGYPKHGQAFSQVCLFGDVFNRNIMKYFGLKCNSHVRMPKRVEENGFGYSEENFFLLLRG